MFTGDDFLRNVDTAAIFPPKAFEALITVTSQTAKGTPISPTGGTGVLDTIGTAAGFSGLFSEGGYTPTGFGAGTGHSWQFFSVENYIGYVPRSRDGVINDLERYFALRWLLEIQSHAAANAKPITQWRRPVSPAA